MSIVENSGESTRPPKFVNYIFPLLLVFFVLFLAFLGYIESVRPKQVIEPSPTQTTNHVVTEYPSM